MKNNEFIVKLNRSGELELPNIHKYTVNKYKADNPFFYGAIPYLLMLICIIIDVAFFKSLFVRISYDEPMMIYLEVAGLAFAADVVAAYAGINAKQISQGLSHEKKILKALIGVPISALAINMVLRCVTINQMTPDGSVNAATVALTIISIVTPIFTSVGNYAISYLTYDPLAKKMYKEELALESIRDERRRLSALMADYEYDNNCTERLLEMDRKYFHAAKKELVNDAVQLYGDACQKLMEYMGDPAASNVLSEVKSSKLLDRLERELRELETICQ